VSGTWPGPPVVSNAQVLKLRSSSFVGQTITEGIVDGGPSPSGTSPGYTSVKGGILTAHFNALSQGTAIVDAQYVGQGQGFPIALKVRVVPRS
jgi:hypothetical protein